MAGPAGEGSRRDPSQRPALDRAADCLRGADLGRRPASGVPSDRVAELAGESGPTTRCSGRSASKPCGASRRRSRPPRCSTALESVARGTDPDARALAADALGPARPGPRRGARRAARVRPAELQPARSRRAPAARRSCKAAAGQVHYQAVVLPALIAAKDVDDAGRGGEGPQDAGGRAARRDRGAGGDGGASRPRRCWPRSARPTATTRKCARPRGGRCGGRSGRRKTARRRSKSPRPRRGTPTSGLEADPTYQRLTEAADVRPANRRPTADPPTATPAHLAYAGASRVATAGNTAAGRAVRQPRPPAGPARRPRQGPAPVPRGDVRPLRRRRQRLPLRPQGPDRLPRLPAACSARRPTSASGRRSRRTSPGCSATTRSPSASSTRSSRSTPTRSSSRSSARTRAPTPGSASTATPSTAAGDAGLRHDQHRLQPRRCFDGVQQMRSYRETRLRIGHERRDVATAAARQVLEKKIQVPDSWLRGFLQVQSAATLPLDHVPPRADRPVQRAPPPAAARRPQGQAPRPAVRAGPRRAAAAGAGAVGDGAHRDRRRVPRQGGAASSASGAAAGS